ncbi:MAG: SWIM zinc finger family protein [Lachnospiraceae bacterium]
MGRSYWNTGESYKQPNASQLQKNARQTMKKEKAKGKQLEPVVIQGRTIVKSWWGQAWCDNLERYADFESRLERGKRYVRTGAVVDLKIQKGKVFARVQGRRKTPYKVEVRISPLSEERCQYAIKQCGRKIENLERLVNGDFPKELKELFLGDKGLFPEPREISFNCSCPDWALMCKHVAAVLYGIGARFDENPLLFFELRGIDVERFIDVTLANRVESMLVNAGTPSKRIITGGDWENLFGI